MKTLPVILLIFTMTATFAQSIDYNTKKGAIAEGYDVVSYFEGNPTEGSADFKIDYDHVLFKFSSEENLKRFRQDPEKYIPQYGGYCAYAIASGKKVRINPESFVIRDKKLYLFYNAHGTNTLDLWNEEGAEKLQKEADKNWQKIKFNN
ncbi:YHS domain-containing (seleno)protein [Galbibacter sp. PAP.153]|uniref:YHS domain-containing (seleno)protein n=1 Tax=Galbibacter sp. PAP.153 TaxID=3104623 RepID=UPI00300A319F